MEYFIPLVMILLILLQLPPAMLPPTLPLLVSIVSIVDFEQVNVSWHASRFNSLEI